MAQLRYLDDDGHLRLQTLGTEPLVVGRAATCPLTLTSDMISREHIRIEAIPDGRFQLRDLNSRNKTHVNGQQITDTILTAGDIIRMGDRLLEFLDDSVKREKIDLEFLTPDRTDPPNCEWIKLKSPLSLSNIQLEELSVLFSGINLTSRPEDVANAALGQLMIHLAAERGFIAMRGEGKRDLRVIAHRSLKKPPSGSLTPVSQSFVYSAVLQGVAGRYPDSSSHIDAKLGYASAGLVAPLTFRGEVMGVIYLDRPSTKKAFTTAALPAVAAAGAQLGALMAETSRQLLESSHRESVAWMSSIRRLQSQLTCEVKSSETFEVGATTYHGRARCGDFCEVISVDEHRIVALVVDAGGSGATGIAQASAIRYALRSAIEVSEDILTEPNPAFGALNKMLADSRSRQVVSCTFVAIDISAGRATYVNAGGMPPVLMVAPGRLITLDTPSLVLGIDCEYDYEASRVDLPEVFRLVCYTDGLVEAAGAGGEPLGSERLHEIFLDQATFGSVPVVQSQIKAAWDTHLGGVEADDDASILVIARGKRAPSEKA